jgi:hypothetical protein
MKNGSRGQGIGAMAVTDLQVATLRAQLAGDLEEHKRLLAQFDENADGRPYATLTNAAFVEAADRSSAATLLPTTSLNLSATCGHGPNGSGFRWILG